MKNKLFLTESEKSRISGLHRRAIANESKNMLNEVDLKQIQQLLMQKFGPESLGPRKDDGSLGKFTLDALYSALTQTQKVVGDQGTSGTAGTSGVQGTSGTVGVAGTSGTAGVAGTSATVIPGQPKSAQQIRQDYRQQKQNERQTLKSTKNSLLGPELVTIGSLLAP